MDEHLDLNQIKRMALEENVSLRWPVMLLCDYIATLEKEIADARSEIHDLQTRLSEMETD